MVVLALGMWSVVLGPVVLLFAGGSPAAVLFSADINATPPKVPEYTVFITQSWRHIFELGNGLYIMHPWLLFNPVILGAYLFGVPFLLWRVRASVAAQLLFGALVVVTVAVYAPPVATFIGNNLIVPGLLWRLAWPIPLLSLIATGWMAWEALGRAGARLKTPSGFSPIEDAPGQKYNLHKVDPENPGKPASGPDRPKETTKSGTTPQ